MSKCLLLGTEPGEEIHFPFTLDNLTKSCCLSLGSAFSILLDAVLDLHVASAALPVTIDQAPMETYRGLIFEIFFGTISRSDVPSRQGRIVSPVYAEFTKRLPVFQLADDRRAIDFAIAPRQHPFSCNLEF